MRLVEKCRSERIRGIVVAVGGCGMIWLCVCVCVQRGVLEEGFRRRWYNTSRRL